MNSKFKPTQHVIVIDIAEGGVPRLLNLAGRACSKDEIGILLTALEHHGQDDSLISEEPCEDGDPGYVYLIAGAGHHKIGKSKDVKSRHRTLRINMPFEITLEHHIRTSTMRNLEQYWHHRFGEKRLNGEWFKLTERDTSLFCSFTELNLSDDDFLLAIGRLFAFNAIQTTADIYGCQATLEGVVSLHRSVIGPYTEATIDFVKCTFEESGHLAYLDGELFRFIG